MDLDYNRNGIAFSYLARCVMIGRGSVSDALLAADDPKLRAPDQTRMILRSAQDIGSIGNSTWGPQLAGFSAAVDGFISSIAHLSVFDRMLAGGIRKVPLRSRVVASSFSVPARGYIVDESRPKPISRVSLTGIAEEPAKAACIIVLSKELTRNQASGSAEFFAIELKQAVVAVTDAEFLRLVLATAPRIDSQSGGGGTILGDIAELLEAVTIDANSRLYLVTTSQVAKWLSTRTAEGTEGVALFPDMTPTGGSIAGIPVLVTDQLEAESDGETMALIDASAIAGNTDTMSIDSSEEACMELNDAPTGDAGATMTSLWQNDLMALRVERYFKASKLRETGFAVLTGIHWGNHT